VIAVIGGSGFVGTRLCKRLRAGGHDFVIIDKVPSADYPDHWRYGDVRDIESLRASIPSRATVINLAAEHRDNVRPATLYHEVNVVGAKLVCDVAAERGCRQIIFTSSVACYGFAPPGTGEDGTLAPFNEYGRTKAAAEAVYRDWQRQNAGARSLVIVRPTVIFGERNRGNVYNLMRQVSSGHFAMVGSGSNVKSMAYVENVAAFLEHALTFSAGVHLYNYVDSPDLDMNTIVALFRKNLGRGGGVGVRIPFVAGLLIGYMLDGMAKLTGRDFPLSAIRVRKFCATTHFTSSAVETGFTPPVGLADALERTLNYEFIEGHADEAVFFSE
jgi:nucleoside-diphosphate-sugar epimerase